MKHFLLVISTSIFCNFGFCQRDTTTYYFKEVGITIKVPTKFETVESNEDEKLRIKGEKTIEVANNVQIDASSTINLLSIRQGQFNYLNITVTPYKQLVNNGWERDNKDVKNMIYKSFVEKVTSKNIDTASTSVEVNGIKMDRFEMTIKIATSMTMKMLLFSKFYKGFDFGICYVYVDDGIGKEFEHIVYSSLFKK